MPAHVDEVLRQWGENIRMRREALDAEGNLRTGNQDPMTQAELGQHLDPPVNQSSVARWERGLMEPRRHYKQQLAGVLRTDVRLLFPMTAVPA